MRWVRERVREGAGRCCGGGTAEACLWRAVGRVVGVGKAKARRRAIGPCKLRNWPVCSYAIGPLHENAHLGSQNGTFTPE